MGPRILSLVILAGVFSGRNTLELVSISVSLPMFIAKKSVSKSTSAGELR